MALTVVKCGGALLAKEPFALARYVEPGRAGVRRPRRGRPHLGGAAAAGIESVFVGGRRVTSAEAIPIVREAFRARTTSSAGRSAHGRVGLMGDDLGLEADPFPSSGRAGMLRPVVPAALRGVLESGAVPVIAPLARGPLNVNADDAAAVLAVALRADRLVFASDVPGVIVEGQRRADPVGRARSPRSAGSCPDGIVPKLQAALLAAREGIRVDVGLTSVVA